MKTAAAPAVTLARNVAAPRPPKNVWLAPPKAAPMSAPLPACRSTTMMRSTPTRTCSTVTSATITGDSP